jgi:hypothetical protein
MAPGLGGALLGLVPFQGRGRVEDCGTGGEGTEASRGRGVENADMSGRGIGPGGGSADGTSVHREDRSRECQKMVEKKEMEESVLTRGCLGRGAGVEKPWPLTDKRISHRGFGAWSMKQNTRSGCEGVIIGQPAYGQAGAYERERAG